MVGERDAWHTEILPPTGTHTWLCVVPVLEYFQHETLYRPCHSTQHRDRGSGTDTKLVCAAFLEAGKFCCWKVCASFLLSPTSLPHHSLCVPQRRKLCIFVPHGRAVGFRWLRVPPYKVSGKRLSGFLRTFPACPVLSMLTHRSPLQSAQLASFENWNLGSFAMSNITTTASDVSAPCFVCPYSSQLLCTRSRDPIFLQCMKF